MGKRMKRRIKELVEGTLDDSSSSSHPLLQEAAREFFERRERAFRPTIVILAARALQALKRSPPAVFKLQCQLAEIVEMMSTAQAIHDDVLEDAEHITNGNIAHRMYSANLGNKVSVLAGDFLLARCSVELARLANVEVVEVMANALESMVHGEIMHNQAFPRDRLDSEYYVRTAALKTASLTADSCKSVALLAGHDVNSTIAVAMETYGRELGIAYQVMYDTIALQAALEEATDGRLPVAHHASPPMFLSSAESPWLREWISQGGLQEDCTLAEVAAHIADTNGIERARAFALEHAQAAADAITSALPHSQERDALLVMCHYATQHDQEGLQRDRYIEAQRQRAQKAS